MSELKVRLQLSELKLKHALKEVDQLKEQLSSIKSFESLDKIATQAHENYRTLVDIYRSHPDCRGQVLFSMENFKSDLINKITDLMSNWKRYG